jgi:hypothetical protein
MVISFIKYEIRFNLEKKDAEVLESQRTLIGEQLQQLRSTQPPAFDTTMKASAPEIVVE